MRTLEPECWENIPLSPKRERHECIVCFRKLAAIQLEPDLDEHFCYLCLENSADPLFGLGCVARRERIDLPGEWIICALLHWHLEWRTKQVNRRGFMWNEAIDMRKVAPMEKTPVIDIEIKRRSAEP